MDKTYIDKLAFIELRDGKVLMTRSKGKDTWYIPGGKREGSESDIEALVREVKEELAVEIVPDSAAYYGTFEAQAHGKPEGTMVRMTCYRARYTGEPAAASEIDELAWFTYRDVDRTAPVDHLIFADLRARGLLAE